MKSWGWCNPAHQQVVYVFLVVLPATTVFAFAFFWFCEKPFMVRRRVTAAVLKPEAVSARLELAKEGFLSRAFLSNLRTRLNVLLRRGTNAANPDAKPATGAVGPATRIANAYADSIAVADSQN